MNNLKDIFYGARFRINHCRLAMKSVKDADRIIQLEKIIGDYRLRYSTPQSATKELIKMFQDATYYLSYTRREDLEPYEECLKKLKVLQDEINKLPKIEEIGF